MVVQILSLTKIMTTYGTQDDLCFDTTPGQAVDQNGCSEDQKDDDQDGMMNSVDQCPNTQLGEIIDGNGCSLSQLDTDGDGVNDLEDAFPEDSNESVDTDSDGVQTDWMLILRMHCVQRLSQRTTVTVSCSYWPQYLPLA